MKYLMVTGTSAAELERLTGIQGRDTKFGVFAEAPPANPYRDIAKAMVEINQRLGAPPARCTCGSWSIIHRFDCTAGAGVT